MPGYTRRLVLKAIPKARVSKPTQRQRIQNEIQLHKGLNHENIVNLYHSFDERHAICLIIERCERSLLDLLQEQNRKVREEDVSVVARQALKGLEYLYYQNVIHRDLKLGNILLKNQLLVKICDFGLAKFYCRTDKPTICGTPNYLAPEVLLHQGHRPVSDVWSLGCVLVVLLTGRAPFEGVSTEETYDMIMHKELAIPGKVSEETESFLVGLLTKQHRERMSVFEALEHPFIKMYAHILGQKIEEAKTEDMETAAIWPKNEESSPLASSPRRTPLAPMSNTRNRVPRLIRKNLLRRLFKPDDQRSQGYSGDPQLCQLGIDREGIESGQTTICGSVIGGGASDLDTEPVVDDYDSELQLWIQCWIDYTNKDCGFAYRLSNDTVGVKLKFEKMSYVLKRTLDRETSDFKYEYYSESRNKLVNFKKLDDMEKKIDDRFRRHVQEMQNLVDYYDNYMQNNLISAGNMPNVSQNDVCKVRLLDWFKTKYCVAMVLTNYTLQVNFFSTHFKIVIQGQFDQPDGFSMPIPQTPSKPSNRKTMSVIAMSPHDVKQEFKIMFVNSKRRCFQLDVGVVLYLIQFPDSVHPNVTKILEITPDELLTTLTQTHDMMHKLKPFSDRCYTESLLCTAFRCAGAFHEQADENVPNQSIEIIEPDAAGDAVIGTAQVEAV